MRTLPLILFLAACGLPRDPERTLERIHQQGVMRVGLAESELAPVETALIRNIASRHGVRIEWKKGSIEEHFRALEKYEVDLVAGAIEKTTPWSVKVSTTRPYDKKHVLAVPPGENAWLIAVENELP